MSNSNFIIKFELPSARVKRVCFHPSRPWVLCGLHNGVVQIIDYRTRAVVDHYHEHEGPVRGADFHVVQPLFVTGGDDYKIKVWNYKLRRCLFTLTGHLDYIRMTAFHREQPWIVSASDDSTVCLWNWQNRQRMAVLTGHNHYVMSAAFHPTQDLVVSASLDLTIRVWDIAGLRSRNSHSTRASSSRNSAGSDFSQDLFGSNDVVVKFILEGHEQGVNYASFHPSKPFIVSAADDRTVRIWRMEEMRCFELEQLRGHNNNVSSVSYFKDVVVSNSEDRSIRVWDPSSRSLLQSYRRPGDRFWTIAVHPTQNVLAAGHDNGMIVFKLERERPAFDVINRNVYWVKDKALKMYDFDKRQEIVVGNVRRYEAPPVSLSVSPSDNAMAMSFDSNGAYELCSLRDPTASKTGGMEYATFFGTNRFVCLDKTRQLVIRTSMNEISKVVPPVADVNRIFRGPQGMVLLRAEDKVYLYDLAQKAVISEVAVPKVKYVQWDPKFNRVALMSRNALTICTRRLKVINQIAEANKIKSCVFDESRGVAVYATSDHLKYCSLHSGDAGTIRTLALPIYLVHAENDKLFYITRENKMVMEAINNTELAFKLAVQQEKYRDVLKFIQEGSLHGQALVAHLQKTGHPDIALHFVEDPLVKFHLALQCGMLDVAKEVAGELNQPDCWRLLARAAVNSGDIQLSQRANAITKNYPGLGTQCIVTGNINALTTVAGKSGDDNTQMHFGMMSGEVENRLKLLKNAKQYPLAYSLALTNGLTEEAEAILEDCEPEVAERLRNSVTKKLAKNISKSGPIRPPAPEEPVADNWPMLPVTESVFAKLIKDPSSYQYTMESANAVGDISKAAWGGDDDDDLFDDEDNANKDGDHDDDNNNAVQLDVFGEVRKANGEVDAAASGNGAAWDDDDLDDELDSDEAVKAQQQATAQANKAALAAGFVVPTEGENLEKHWINRSNIPSLHVAAGSFRTALDLLSRQIGLVDPAPLEGPFMQIWSATHYALPSQSLLPSRIFTASAQPPASENNLKTVPRLPAGMLSALKEKKIAGYKEFTEGKFADSLETFRYILHRIPLIVIDKPEDADVLRDLLAVSREYTAGLLVEIERQKVAASNPSRAIELAAYFSTFKLQHDHVILTTGQAMTQSFKAKCKKLAATLARRLLDYQPPQDKAERARKVITAAEADPNNAFQVDYDERNPSVLCNSTMKPIYRGTTEPVKCTYCQAASHESTRGGKCPVCLLGRIGGDVTGLQSLRGTAR